MNREAVSVSALPDHVKSWVLTATILGSSLAFILSSVVNVALPAIQIGLAASAPQMQWVINAYLLFLGALILVGGSAGDRFGRRRIFLIGTSVFAAASIWCGLAPTANQLIVARGVQGIGGALLVPSSLAIISATYPQEERGAAIGTWAGFSALTTAIGPVIGGWLVDTGSWRWVFFIVVPFALATIGVTLWRVPESRERSAGVLDWPGALLATVGLSSITYGLIASSEAGWTAAPVITSLAGGIALLIVFLWVEARSETPMMPLELFRSATFTGANAMTLALYFSLQGALFFLPFNLIQVQGYSATAAGAAFLPFTLLLGVFSRWAGGLIDRYGARRPLIVGPIIAGVGFALLAIPGIGGSYWTTFFPALLVLGVGMTISVAPLTTTVMSAVDDRQAGTASGINNAAARVAGLLAIAVLGVVALSVFASALDQQLAAMDAPASVEQAVWAARDDLAAITVPERADADTTRALQSAIDAAFVTSFRWVMLITAGVAFLSALCAGVSIRDEVVAGSPESNQTSK